jgi:hypothetical protein
MDRSLVQAKQGRSSPETGASPEMGANPETGLNPAVGDTIELGSAKLTARRVTCRDSRDVRLDACGRGARGSRNPTPDTSDAYRAPEDVPFRRVEAAPIRSPAR